MAFVGVMDDRLWLWQIMPYELCFVHGFRYFCIFVCKDSLSVGINQEFMVRRACIYLLLLLVISIATSCRDDGRAEGLLRTVDSLMEERPDSSLALLSRDSAVFARSGKAVRMAYTLSKTEAEDKCYIPHRSDSAILPVAEYFAEHGTPLQQVRSQYILGRVYCDLRLYGHALTAFDNALAVKPDGDSAICRYKARAATWAGFVYEEKDLHNDALRYNKLSYKYAKKADVPTVEVYSLRDIGRSYSYLKKNDVAISYYKRASERARTLNDRYLYNMVMEELAAIYIEERRLDDACKALSTPFLGGADMDIAAHYFTWADYYKSIGRFDSAIVYNKRGMTYGDEGVNKSVSLELAILNKKIGRRDEALKYYELYFLYADYLRDESITENAGLLAHIERMLGVERENVALADAKMRLTVLLSVIIFVVIAATFIIVRYYLNVRKRLCEQQERVKAYLREQRGREMRSIKHNEERIAQLQAELLSSKAELTELQRSLKRNEAEMLVRRNEQMRVEEERRELLKADFTETEMYKLFHNPTASPSQADYHRLVDALNKAYDGFTLRLKDFYPGISDTEMWFCCMTKSGLSSKETCNISVYSFSALSMAKSRLYAKMFNKKGSARELDNFVRSF